MLAGASPLRPGMGHRERHGPPVLPAPPGDGAPGGTRLPSAPRSALGWGTRRDPVLPSALLQVRGLARDVLSVLCWAVSQEEQQEPGRGQLAQPFTCPPRATAPPAVTAPSPAAHAQDLALAQQGVLGRRPGAWICRAGQDAQGSQGEPHSRTPDPAEHLEVAALLQGLLCNAPASQNTFGSFIGGSSGSGGDMGQGRDCLHPALDQGVSR